MANDDIPVHVEREMGSDGEPTGKYVFEVNNLHKFYYADFDPGVMEVKLENAGYNHREFRPIIREMERQHDALQDAAILAKAKAPTKKPVAPVEEPTE